MLRYLLVLEILTPLYPWGNWGPGWLPNQGVAKLALGPRQCPHSLLLSICVSSMWSAGVGKNINPAFQASVSTHCIPAGAAGENYLLMRWHTGPLCAGHWRVPCRKAPHSGASGVVTTLAVSGFGVWNVNPCLAIYYLLGLPLLFSKMGMKQLHLIELQ